ncbi:trans-sulfuration enzyme family protein [Chromobacterium vaccinii]|uniref:Cystathionine gamma-synthase n=1 Tax=Chromobacterium vaccinii TaxID=1108595 RepID=A0A1D9LK26_9NEIS|nr:PLP-dependent aspartate aminotransferase family protein [Chromobacterium vaccinii]AOZ51574.1 cystathionine gamma-synthase [Chromobacterium vaccinii]QND86998.1 Methionine gamma-lyase [Chromobacterium vaccinii]QND92229.1 Methionine gamma-lyase [Chromobacterium vaccinii]
MKFATRAIHVGYDNAEHNRSVMPPLYQTSAFAFDHVGEDLRYAYARTGNPTRSALQDCLASLEDAKHGLAFSSGMAAIDAVLRACLKPGDEVIAVADLYGGAYRLLTRVMEPAGIKVSFVDLSDPARLEMAITPDTRLLWLESPTNPLLGMVDIAELSAIARRHGVKVAVDSTFATPYLQRPLALGADIVVHSATKYLGGHSDVLLGLVAVSDDKLHHDIRFLQNAAGAVPGPQDCFLTLRGIKTLALRMERHCDSAEKVAAWLLEQPAVAKVFYPGLPEHPGHELAKRQMKRFGGIISIRLKDNSREAASRVAQKLKLFALAESLGGVESLVNHSYTMSHGGMPAEQKAALGIVEGGLRLSIGIEDLDDILEDLAQALRD